MTSEEDNISVSGSPAVIRRRMGVIDNPNKEDNLSPGIHFVNNHVLYRIDNNLIKMYRSRCYTERKFKAQKK